MKEAAQCLLKETKNFTEYFGGEEGRRRWRQCRKLTAVQIRNFEIGMKAKTDFSGLVYFSGLDIGNYLVGLHIGLFFIVQYLVV